ncbi:MAG TPA: maleylpyruvate isomerase family mycothiol-dependent enzyme [Ilumatobacteraceae bacterium]|nr:maleylpyruvate isomerase family mycothiol-dependent enzyme [Ilumatobacteraceae bacterium]
MDLNGYVAVLAGEAGVLAAAGEEAGLDAAVPTCPGWKVSDLLLHMGEVHRWATAVVASQATKLGAVPSDFLGPLPEREATFEWVRTGAAVLCDTLATADPAVEYAAFLNDPMTPRLLFWARRQTLETSMHRVDAESATGRCTGFSPEVALDGIDEFLTGFLPRSRTSLHSQQPRSLHIAPDYSERCWTVRISDDVPSTTRSPAGESPATCTVAGSASDIYLALWNRGPLDSLRISGDPQVIESLRENVRVRWG